MPHFTRFGQRGGMTAVVLVAAVTALSADAGPKPSIAFNFDARVAHAPILGGDLLQCDDATCATSKPLAELGPQRIVCSADACTAQAYGFAQYQRLRLRFADGTRESQVFETTAFSARFMITVTDHALVVNEIWVGSALGPPMSGGFLSALGVTMIVELVVAAICFLFMRVSLGALPWVIVANLISLPVVWFVFPRLPLGAALSLALAEGFAVVFEALFLYATNRKRGLSLRRAGIVSFAMNAASFAAGLVAVGLS